MTKLEKIIQQFQSLDEQYRLELLLDYSDKLPPLPEKFVAAKKAGANRVSECLTLVYLFTAIKDGKTEIFADVAEEAPTVKGIVSVIMEGLNGESPEAAKYIPLDLLSKLGISRRIGMVRLQGLSAIIHRIKDEITQAAANNDKLTHNMV